MSRVFDGLAWLKSLPEPWPASGPLLFKESTRRLQERSAATIDAMLEEPLRWWQLEIVCPQHVGLFAVTTDAITVGATNPIRMPTSHLDAELIARRLGHHLVTPLIADQIHRQATTRCLPQIEPSTWRMASQDWIVTHSAKCDDELGNDPKGLIDGTGKHWVCTDRMVEERFKAWNYGWHSPFARCPSASLVGVRVWQPLACAHDLSHVDYSQTLRLLHGDCEVDGVNMRTADVAMSDELWRLVSHERPLELRHPDVRDP